MQKAFLDTDQIVISNKEKVGKAGSTAVVCLLVKMRIMGKEITKLHLSNAGDSKAILW